MAEVQTRYVVACHGSKQGLQRKLVVPVLAAGRRRLVAGEGVVYGFFNTVLAAQVFKGVSEAVKDFARVGDADFLTQIARKPVAEVAAAFAAWVELEIGKQVAAFRNVFLSVAHMLKKAAGNEHGVQRDIASRVRVLELGGGVAQVRNAQVVAQPFGDVNIADLQLRQLFEASAGVKGEQGQPEAGDFATAQRQVTLRVDRRSKDPAQIIGVETDPRLMRALVGQLEGVCRIFIEQFLIDGRVEYGF